MQSNLARSGLAVAVGSAVVAASPTWSVFTVGLLGLLMLAVGCTIELRNAAPR